MSGATVHGQKGTSTGEGLFRWYDTGVAIGLFVLLVVLLVPADGVMPGTDLDLSWPYTLADATARRIPFGRDLVFTFGPLAPLYTRFFLPDQRLAFDLAKLVLVLAFCLGAVAISRRPLRWLTLALPLPIAALMLSDSLFLVMPWVMVPLATLSWRNQRWHSAALVALTVIFAPLLLVKGTFAIPLGVSIGAAALLIARQRPGVALALPCAAAVSVVVAWIATGQHLLDLAFFLKRETYVAGGYTNAMSTSGDLGEIWTYLVGAVVWLALSAVVPRRAPSMVLLSGAAVLFVAFKAGFVRHDGHANIAGGTLVLLGFLMFLYRGTLAAGGALLASLAVSLSIFSHYWAVDPEASWARVSDGLRGNRAAIETTLRDPDAFRRSFEASKAQIAATGALPPTTGTVDLYPNIQALLLASDRDYDPRPVMQSYSAYTPELAFLNADHLEGPHAPQTAFFAVAPIDGRYPALEDGPSWPALLGQYRFRTYSGPYAVIDRVPGAAAGSIGPPLVSGTSRFGDSVTVPPEAPFVWAKMQFHPTWLGRAASALFKMPLLWMDVTTADGRTETFRLVPGMASAGFLLSPTVTSARDFVALRSTATDALASQRVTAIRLHEDGDLGLWGSTFSVQFAALHIPTDPAVDDAVLGHLDEGPAVGTLPVGGECTIDTVGGKPAASAPVEVSGQTVTVTGWGYVSRGADGRDGGDLRIALTSAGRATAYAKAERQARPDVDAYFHLNTPTRAGFTAQVNLSAIDGDATLDIVQDGPTGPASCGAPVAIVR